MNQRLPFTVLSFNVNEVTVGARTVSLAFSVTPFSFAVIVAEDGGIRVFGYPYNVFEPTDFHTATLVGDFIWIIGGLGYPDQRHGSIPVYRLDIRDYSIERILTSGDVPARFHKHRATFSEGNVIEIVTGSENRSIFGQRKDEKTSAVLRLNTGTRVWTR